VGSGVEKHVREYQQLLQTARTRSSLTEGELGILGPLLVSSPSVVHLQSGHGLDDVDLVAAGARRAVGVDFSQVAAPAAMRRARELAAACRYVVAEVPRVPLRDQCADLVYTGKGALIWMRDLATWAAEAARLLRPAGHLWIYEAHPMVPLWTWDKDEPRIRPDRSYFGRCHQNDTFPARGRWNGNGRWDSGASTPSLRPGWICGTSQSTPRLSGDRKTSRQRHGKAGFPTPSACSHSAARISVIRTTIGWPGNPQICRPLYVPLTWAVRAAVRGAGRGAYASGVDRCADPVSLHGRGLRWQQNRPVPR
jgi:SAM-dependent methyltransferase